MFKIDSILLEPLYKLISYSSALEFGLQKLGHHENIVFLHSGGKNSELSRYSFIGLSPFLQFESSSFDETDNSIEILNKLEEIIATHPLKKIPGLPAFQGGIAGYFSYDLGRTFEKLPIKSLTKTPTPLLAVGVYDLVISMDHHTKKAWIISSGLPEVNKDKRFMRAQERLNWAVAEIMKPNEIAPSETHLLPEDIQSNFTEKMYCEAVTKAIEYIKNGDIFQVNLSQCFSCKLPKGLSAFQLFQRLQRYNPAPFSAFIAIGQVKIISSSPERFVKIDEDTIETRPIKGTIKRSADPSEDYELARLLINSEKDRAENTMIVDLMRNDLAKICLPHSIHVKKLCGLETFETVHHLVSVIQGGLRPNVSFKELLQAVLPGGSITGAPKIRAMEIIEELEPLQRDLYCGNAFYYGFNGTFDSSILIRTFVLCQDELRFSAGGAIVLDSTPEAEYRETQVKALALIKSLLMPQAEKFSGES
ncbi:MAG: aminodeoxychorismate synthase component I [Legionella sp.]|nr:aminodeoxychorismate synthase component I [Legionella sp.]